MMQTARRTALVTGGAVRVGRVIVERFIREGFDVAFTFHKSADAANDLIKQNQTPATLLAIDADLSNPETAVQRIGETVEKEFGRLDVLVNNASAYLPARLRETDAELMRTVDAIHLQSPVLLCKRFEPLLRAARGHVVNMVDLLAEKPWPQYLAYSASKAALANATIGLARELAPEVTVNGIAPGVVDWPADYPQEEREKYLKRVPLGRAGTPIDVANLVHYLCTEGSYITGQIIRLDGGRSVT